MRTLGFILVLFLVGLVRPAGVFAQVGGERLGNVTYGPPAPGRLDLGGGGVESKRVAREAGVVTVPLDHSRDMAFPDLSKTIPTTTSPQGLSTSIQILILLSVITLAPSILLMMTCFTRVIIVLSLLRQAMGTQSLPPNQVMVGLALFITFLVMGPTWTRINHEAIDPYREGKMSQFDAIGAGTTVLRDFMINQIVAAHNEDDVYMFYSYANKEATLPREWKDVGTTTIIPAFILSELKVSFLMGFRIYLPFLIIDMVISSILISIGMQLLPPAMISLPFKLLLFVLVDGWHLVTATLLSSFN